MAQPSVDRLINLRREFHQHPEPAWCEFYTTSRIVEELERIGVDDRYLGREMLADERTGVPDEAELARWLQRARDAGAREEVLEALEGGWTGATAVLHRGAGPTVALRVDIDALPRAESTASEHTPVAEGFRPAYDDAMHACGHDAHMTIGLGVLEAIAASEFQGTFIVCFQPAEEVVGGGEPLAASGLLDEVDALFAVHVGLDHPTGEVVAGMDDFLAVRGFTAEFTGEGAHAGASPNAGENAVQALATAVENLYGIPRHADGITRVNAGVVSGGTASNIVPEEAVLEGEVRGGTTELRQYMWDRARRVLEGAASMHGCGVDVETGKAAPSAASDRDLADIVAAAARETPGVDSVVDRAALGGSEDAAFLMRRVQNNGGAAAFVCIGTDHPGAHHSATFDVDEDSIRIGVEVLTNAIQRVATNALD